MALNKSIMNKLAEKAGEDQNAYDAMIKLLEAEDEGKQLKRILEPILKTL